MSRQKPLVMALLVVGVAASILVVVVIRLHPRSSSLGAAQQASPQPDPQLGADIDALMNEYVEDKAPSGPVEYTGGGWMMTMPSGRPIVRDGLRIVYAAPLIKYGPAAVPHLLKWVMHDNLAIRYIAAYSLEQITGIRSEIRWFDKKDADHQRERAISAWKQWWEARRD